MHACFPECTIAILVIQAIEICWQSAPPSLLNCVAIMFYYFIGSNLKINDVDVHYIIRCTCFGLCDSV